MKDLAITLVEIAAGSTLIVVVAAIACLALRKSSAATRHLVWLIAFVSILVLPAARLVAPALQVPLPSLVKPAPVIEPQIKPTPIWVDESWAYSAQTDLSAPVPLPLPQIGSVDRPIAASKPWGVREGAIAVAALWALGAALLVLQITAGAVRLQRIRTDHPVGKLTLQPGVLLALSIRAGLRRQWTLRINRESSPPAAMTWGALQPVVLLPEKSPEWSEHRLEAVLLHELAHVRRWDSASQLLTAVVCALHWFNPIVWLGARAMRAEAESAADDVVLASGIKPSAYAGELLRIAAELGRRRQPFASVGVSVMKQAKIESRVVAILDNSRRRRGVGSLQALAATAIGFAALIPIAGLRPAQVQEPKNAQTHVAQTVVEDGVDPLVADLSAVNLEPQQPKPAPVPPKAKPKVKPKAKYRIVVRPKHLKPAPVAPKATPATLSDRSMRQLLLELSKSHHDLTVDHHRLGEILQILQAERAREKASALDWNARAALDQRLSTTYIQTKVDPVALAPATVAEVKYELAKPNFTIVSPQTTINPSVKIDPANGVVLNQRLSDVLAKSVATNVQVLKTDPTIMVPQYKIYTEGAPPTVVYRVDPVIQTPAKESAKSKGYRVYTYSNGKYLSVDPAKFKSGDALRYESSTKVYTLPTRKNYVYVKGLYSKLYKLNELSPTSGVRSDLDIANAQLKEALDLLTAQERGAKEIAAAKKAMLEAQAALQRAAALMKKAQDKQKKG
jgi:beta-lactamase regulating signal transducer with metallopeptidase domain